MKPYMNLQHKETHVCSWRELSTLWKVWALKVPFPSEHRSVRTPLGDHLLVQASWTDAKDSNGKPVYRLDFFNILSVHPENIGKD